MRWDPGLQALSYWRRFLRMIEALQCPPWNIWGASPLRLQFPLQYTEKLCESGCQRRTKGIRYKAENLISMNYDVSGEGGNKYIVV
jgi:hypothetical protein